jgi:hypothetical protein
MRQRLPLIVVLGLDGFLVLVLLVFVLLVLVLLGFVASGINVVQTPSP